MSNPIGSTMGPYQITAGLGSGGMGEVYRAYDPRLGRTVALKILPASHAESASRRRRFEIELRALAALNHPNIVAVYDTGFENGRPFIVTECLDGQTLRDRMAHRPSIAARLDYAVQIARGLGGAHSRGILHRDLKPENIFVTTDTRVKILDFGLASAADDGDQTITHADQTEPGTAAGTAAYMSPEQALGEKVDRRSDIFSFGAMLYELLSGRRLFQRASRVDTLHAIVHDELPSALGLDPGVPPFAEAVLRRCLEKDPAKRFQSADDLAFALAAQIAPAPASASVRRPGRIAFVVGMAATAAVLGVAFAAWQRVGARVPSASVPRFTQLTFRRGYIANARFSPDERTVIYSASWDGRPFQVFSTQPDSPESRPLDVPSGSILAVSKSGELALLIGCDFAPAGPGCEGTLARMAATGAAPRSLIERAHWADFSPDGQLAVVRIVGDTYRLEFPIGRVLRQVARPGFIGHVRFSPAGDTIAFLEQSAGSYSLKTVTLDGTVKTIVDRLGISFGLAWAPDGREIWYTSYVVGTDYIAASPFTLFAADLSGRTRLRLRPPGGIMVMDIARDGRLLAASYDYRVTAMAKLTGDTEERDYSVFNNARVRELSADGRALLLMDQPHGGAVRIGAYVRRQDAPAPVRLFDGASAFALSPDGSAVLRTGRTKSGLQLEPVGAGEPSTILAGSSIVWQAAEFPLRGDAVLAIGAPPGRPSRCYVQTPGVREPKPVTPDGVEQCDVSPDGRFVVAASRDSDVRLAVYPADGSPPRNVSGALPGDIPIKWKADGRTLYVRAAGRVPARVFTIDLSTGRRQPWRSLIPADPAGVFDVDSPLIAADADSYAYSYSRFLFDLYQVEGLR